ncbi:cytochrome P450 [Actinophytocola sediminis]
MSTKSMSTVENAIDVGRLESDPYPVYARLRQHEPVAWVPALDLWLVTRWSDVRRVLSSPQTFVTAYPSPVARLCGQQTMLATEGDQHAELRASLDDHFSPEMVPRIVEQTGELAAGYAGALADGGGAELMAAYFKPVAAAALGRLFGLTGIDPPTLVRWSEAMLDGFDNPTGDLDRRRRGETTATELSAIATSLLDRAGTEQDDSLVSHLAHTACPAGASRSPEDIVPTFLNIMSTFVEPAAAAGSTLLALLNQPEQFRLVQADPRRIRDAVREGLRFCPPIGTLGRITTRPVVLGGRELPAGAVIAAAVASANRDPAVYRDPDRFDIDRPAKPNAGLGYGRHRCLAASVVPAIVTTTLRVLLAHLRTPRLDEDHPSRPHGWKFRGPGTLHVRWDDNG